MNMVGIHGQGESVWLGFFLYDVLMRFIPVAEFQNDNDFVETLKAKAAELKSNIEEHAWDGKWYRRAYFDDGMPLGSAQNDDCMIDSIAPMKSVDQYLINRDKGLIQLLEPPFDKGEMDPGYIKGYVPGVRENGGQYTHAAIWMVMAFAKIGDHHHTWELLNMINPINHGKSPEDVDIYKVEPYVMAADVYGVHPHTGRGGTSFKLRYQYQETSYEIEVFPNDNGEQTTIVDGVEQPNGIIKLIDDKAVHTVIIKCPTFIEKAKFEEQSGAPGLPEKKNTVD
jgi:cellobiose phosphorylase